MFGHRLALLSALLMASSDADFATVVGREKRGILKPDVYRCENRLREPILRKNRGKHGEDVYEVGQVLEAECLYPGKDSTPRISMYLNDEPLQQQQQQQVESDDFSRRINGSRVLGVSDSGKRLRCVASDDNNGESEAAAAAVQTSRKIEVYFPPQPLMRAQEDVDRCGYRIGDNAVINVDVYANPEPTLKWSANPDKYMKGLTYDASDRFRILSAQDLENGHWLVKLSIDELRRSDLERSYSLRASNELGSNSYAVAIKARCDEEQRSNFLANGI